MVICTRDRWVGQVSMQLSRGCVSVRREAVTSKVEHIVANAALHTGNMSKTPRMARQDLGPTAGAKRECGVP